MKKYEERLRRIARPLSTTVHETTPVREISYAGKVECNNMIKPKIQQNEIERTASMAAARGNVGGVI